MIGKQGAIVNKLQDEHKVVLEIDSTTGEIKIKGTEEGIASCKVAIEAIANTIEKSFSLEGRSALARALMMAKAERLHAIEAEASVALRVERGEGGSGGGGAIVREEERSDGRARMPSSSYLALLCSALLCSALLFSAVLCSLSFLYFRGE